MKHLLLTLILAICSLAAQAQQAMFYSVPVDGTPETFVTALRDKGLELDAVTEKYGQRIYKVKNLGYTANLLVKYNSNLVIQAMMILMPKEETPQEIGDLFDEVLRMASKDYNVAEFTEVKQGGIVGYRRVIDDGQVFVFMAPPSVSTLGGYNLVYSVENISNSRKSLLLP